MSIPQAVTGTILDIRRFLAFSFDVEVTELILYDGQGEELARIDHFWHVLAPRIRFGDSYESVQFLVVEDEAALDDIMEQVKELRYIVINEDTTETLSPAHHAKKIPTPPLGRNRRWDITTTTEGNVNEFSKFPGA